jgi:site-specific recombinase XerD
MLEEAERDAIWSVFADGGYENTRNDAFIAVFLATFLRYGAVLGIQVGDLNQSTGELVASEKLGTDKPCTIGPAAMKKVRRWLRIRRAQEGVTALWTTAEGTPLTYWGGQSFFKRLKARSGVKRVHAHLLRHTAGQGALLKGATPGEVQEMLGHKTKAMTDRYTRTVKAQVAAANMPRYALV